MKTTSFSVRENSRHEYNEPSAMSSPVGENPETVPLLNGSVPRSRRVRTRSARTSASWMHRNSRRSTLNPQSLEVVDMDSEDWTGVNDRTLRLREMCPDLSLSAVANQVKLVVLFVLIVIATAIVASMPETVTAFRQYAITQKPTYVTLNWQPDLTYPAEVLLLLRGLLVSNYSTGQNLTVQVLESRNKTPIGDPIVIAHLLPDAYNINKDVVQKSRVQLPHNITQNLTIVMTTNANSSLPVSVDYRMLPFNFIYAAIFGAIILLLVYALIVFEAVHRTVAAIVGSFLVLAILSVYNLRPTMGVIVGWLDLDTLTLLFGMMVIVGIFTDTGFFDWMALNAYKIAGGRVWMLVSILCGVSALVSAFLDNVTTILLMAPVTIRLCETLRLPPQKFLLAEVIFSNIGGTATAVGDPPNVLLVSNADLKSASNGGVNFVSFLLHLGLGSLFVIVVSALVLRIQYRGLRQEANSDDYEVRELSREVEVWRRTALSVTMATREEEAVRDLLLDKMGDAEVRLQRRQSQVRRLAQEDFLHTVSRLQEEYYIRDHCLLLKTLLVLATVICAFVVSSVVPALHLDLGWIALLGAVWLLVLSDLRDLEVLFRRVEWSTLVFFAALFALMEGIQQVGLIDWIGRQVVSLIQTVPPEGNGQLALAIFLVQWVSALVSAFVDNIPFTTAMIPVILQLAESGLPLMPLVWALAFGTCLGGNGTIIGASANVVAVGIAEQHGYPITFVDFFKIGFSIMIVSNVVASAYLFVCHLAIGWNG